MFDNDFVPLEYVEINTDLRVAFTDENGSVDLIKAVDHWFNFGMDEGRLGRFQSPIGSMPSNTWIIIGM